jgi:hypothetical protein
MHDGLFAATLRLLLRSAHRNDEFMDVVDAGWAILHHREIASLVGARNDGLL